MAREPSRGQHRTNSTTQGRDQGSTAASAVDGGSLLAKPCPGRRELRHARRPPASQRGRGAIQREGVGLGRAASFFRAPAQAVDSGGPLLRVGLRGPSVGHRSHARGSTASPPRCGKETRARLVPALRVWERCSQPSCRPPTPHPRVHTLRLGMQAGSVRNHCRARRHYAPLWMWTRAQCTPGWRHGTSVQCTVGVSPCNYISPSAGSACPRKPNLPSFSPEQP